MKPIRVILLRYIRFSCSARLSRAQESEWARLPRQESAFLGGPERGSQNRKGARAKQKLRRRRAPQKAPKQCRDRRAGQGTRPNGLPLGGRSRRRDAVIQIIANSRARSGSQRPGGCVATAVANAWLGNWDARNTQQRPYDDAIHTHECDSATIPPANRITDEIYRRGRPETSGNRLPDHLQRLLASLRVSGTG